MALKKGYAKVFLLLLVTLFFIPGITLVFTEYGEHQLNSEYTEYFITDALKENQDVNGIRLFLQENPPSSVCGTLQSDDLRNYQQAVCAEGSELWQFHMMDKVAFWTLIAGGVVLAMVLLLSALAFVSRKGQSLSLTLARRFLMLSSTLEVLVQGAMLVWLSFWGTAFFTQSYFPKLIIIAALLVLFGIWHIVKGIFKKLPPEEGIEGEVVTREAAPALWARIDALAEKTGTAPPDHIVAGIDTNFYVTEAPLTVNQQQLNGRKLYVSIPLLRQLNQEQADGVMVHELTHLREGDTAAGALLGPKLHRFDLYTQLMSQNVATLVVYYPLALYRMLFELAWQRNSREREFVADRAAAQVIAPAAIIESLIKVSAYAGYRAEVERDLFNHKTRHNSGPGISQAIASGLVQHVHSDGFISMMREQNVPPPFDSHPPLAERMHNVGHVVEEQRYAEIAAQLPQQSWVDLMPVAADIEQRLWQTYEQHFSAAHEESLAWRYEPMGEEETALVLKYFPAVTFPLKAGSEAEINYQGVVDPQNGQLTGWDEIKAINHVRRFGTDIIYLQHYQANAQGKKRSAIRLPGIKKEIDNYKATLNVYWQRHQSMRAWQAQEQQESVAAES